MHLQSVLVRMTSSILLSENESRGEPILTKVNANKSLLIVVTATWFYLDRKLLSEALMLMF
jgi:PHD/YefM family antitoxin component YafN of YafNO toxin-antitoxin module